MLWSPALDSFSFSLKSKKVNATILDGSIHPTKRELLKTLMSIFDPLGLIFNVSILLKILLQEVWRSSIAWDQQISDDHYVKWQKWLSYLPAVRNISILRCYLRGCGFSTGVDVQLHIFVDAGQKAYAAVAYFHVTRNDRIEVALVGAKAKVAPLKRISIPRMELESAVLGVRLAKAIMDGHSIRVCNKTFWTDHKRVLSRINADYRRYKQSVIARVSEITEESNKEEWEWISGKLNVADDATK